MNDLESQLKEMPLAKPSPRLWQRIFDGMPETQMPERRRKGPASIVQVRIPLGWAAAAAILMGLAGFVAARQSGSNLPQTPAPRGSTTVEVQIVEVPAGQRHFFDFTGTTEDFLPRDSQIRVETGGNI
jgi:hypothetical protein